MSKMFSFLQWPMLVKQRFKRLKHQWCHRIDERVLMGGLPFRDDIPSLLQEQVGGVINLCEEYDGPERAYSEADIVQLRLPIVDYTPPSIEQVEEALSFIKEQADAGRSTLVHCKAGRGRSAIMALCYLISQHDMSPQEAQRHLKTIRPRVVDGLWERDVVQEVYQEARIGKLPAPKKRTCSAI